MARPKLGDGETQRLQLKISDEELEAIDDWRFSNRVPSRSDAVRRLCQIALKLDDRLSTILAALSNVVESHVPEPDAPELHEASTVSLSGVGAVQELVEALGSVLRPIEAIKSGQTYQEAHFEFLQAQLSVAAEQADRLLDDYRRKSKSEKEVGE